MFPDPYVVQRIMEDHVRESLRQAKNHRLLREAGIDQRSWLSRRACRLLANLGGVLVRLGRRLQRVQVSPAGNSTQLQQADGGSVARVQRTQATWEGR